MKKKLDVLIVARPDHSMQIYNALLGQNKLKFKYLSFKIFPKWVKKLTRSKKMTVVSKNSICSWRMTFEYFCKYVFGFSFAREWDKKLFFDPFLRTFLKKTEVKIIHYWPEHVNEEVANYLKTHPDTIALADIHMPHPKIVYNFMLPIYEKYGINPKSTELYRMKQMQGDLINNVTDIIVPSSYVIDTYKEIYKDKRYHIISYGITVSPSYVKRYRKLVKEFVYAGRISLEKGSDLLLEYFRTHSKINIHLFGGVESGQEDIFKRYYDVPNIFFHGHIPKIELQREMSKYDVGIHLSRFDAYSLSVGELVGAGLPVIVSNYSGNANDVHTYKWGLVTTLDMNQIDKAVNKICITECYNLYCDNIDVFIRENHKQYGERMINFYSKLCGLNCEGD